MLNLAMAYLGHLEDQISKIEQYIESLTAASG